MFVCASAHGAMRFAPRHRRRDLDSLDSLEMRPRPTARAHDCRKLVTRLELRLKQLERDVAETKLLCEMLMVDDY